MLLQFLLSLLSLPLPSPPPPALLSSPLTHPFREEESVHLTRFIELKAYSALHVHNFQ